MAFVIGSYFLAQEVRVKRPQRKAAKQRSSDEPAPAAEEPSRSGRPRYRMRTGVPTGTRGYRSMTSGTVMRMQPCEAACRSSPARRCRGCRRR